jgi:RNA polymerase-binding protein DksA
MKATKLKELRGALERRREEIQGGVDRMDAELRSIGIDQEDEKGGLGNHLAEDGSNVMEAERITTIADDVRDVLAQIDAALARMEDGTYGTCQRCGKPINEERLEAFPYVAYCIECQSLIERQNALYAGR